MKFVWVYTGYHDLRNSAELPILPSSSFKSFPLLPLESLSLSFNQLSWEGTKSWKKKSRKFQVLEIKCWLLCDGKLSQNFPLHIKLSRTWNFFPRLSKKIPFPYLYKTTNIFQMLSDRIYQTNVKELRHIKLAYRILPPPIKC